MLERVVSVLIDLYSFASIAAFVNCVLVGCMFALLFIRLIMEVTSWCGAGEEMCLQGERLD